MKRINIWTYLVLIMGALLSAGNAEAQETRPTAAEAAFPVSEPVAAGPYLANWDSLKQYHFPEWFRDAKFGIWAHWGPQCVPEDGDWYARNLYSQYRTDKAGKRIPNPVYEFHVEHYGHPTVFGFKDIIPLWKAEKWDPDKLVALYKKCGAKYFMAMANHHDNFDMFDSKYQPWNSVKLGPKVDIIGGWAKAAKAQGLPFGVSIHAARAWGWNDGTTRADVDGPKAGQTYDGRLTAADGKGLWWDGLDPQDLYAQDHAPKAKPSPQYMCKYYNRVIDLVNKYHPDLLYFDDDITRGLPLYNDDPSVGLRIAAHFYNTSIAQHGGTLEAVIAAKKLIPEHRKVLMFDIERGGAEEILPEPWQTDTCIGQWHYSKSLADRDGYKKSPEVIRMLADIVSKNGNLMLNVPVRGDGSIDKHEVKIVEEIGAWLAVNGEAIYNTRPWVVFGEGPAAEAAGVGAGTEGAVKKKVRPLGAEDIRFTTSKDGKALYAIFLGWPNGGKLTIHNLGKGPAPKLDRAIRSVDLLGSKDKLTWAQESDGLHVTLPATPPCDSAYSLKLSF